jgi:prophage antirepressor-like protein
MSKLIPFEFESSQVRILMDDNGDPLFIANDAAEALEYKRPNDAINQHCKGAAEYRPLQTAGGTQRVRVIREPDLYRLMAGSTLPSAEAFERKVFEDILPTIRKTGAYHAMLAPGYVPPIEVQIAEAAARMLRLSDTSKVRMLANICEMKGVSPAFLPVYVDEDLTRALTQLLKDHGSPLSAKAANLALLDMGLLAELERKGSKGDTKRFKSLTEAGLQYGRNETSPQNPRETQPLYYVRTFPELLDLINAHLSKDEAA